MIPSPLVRHKTISAQTFSHQPLAHHHDPGAAQIITIPCKRIGPSSLQSHLEQWYGPGNYSVEIEQNLYIIHANSSIMPYSF
ncbi:uncharacterized protein PODANS_7_3130 [Podospora anserina S mat+]|uniref:Podospora anserina S mat+ genomic DNA chromosome 7, supercontig 1 n=1 Tax=Podospora anserina (strain S / ATCC MYA-4624 / DSM 980 / FGSC 10383) TaxID=515849 RepID=B2AVF4_PODAN|nr:uncharacterized protein PODANS_7_3130 [Podospora anserina S mat+]CAP68378.1 unnamed protein product [Podospora anserina S mat+]CDP31849.1 Putative protein of unknown function [Podospora anserina S mat+]